MTNAVPAFEGLTPSEIEEARHSLQQARDAVARATEGLSEAQWSYRPAAGGWSIAEIVEHMAVVQEIVLGPIGQALAGSPEAPQPGCENHRFHCQNEDSGPQPQIPRAPGRVSHGTMDARGIAPPDRGKHAAADGARRICAGAAFTTRSFAAAQSSNEL